MTFPRAAVLVSLGSGHQSVRSQHEALLAELRKKTQFVAYHFNFLCLFFSQRPVWFLYAE